MLICNAKLRSSFSIKASDITVITKKEEVNNCNWMTHPLQKYLGKKVVQKYPVHFEGILEAMTVKHL